jgi:hypothetical protein
MLLYENARFEYVPFPVACIRPALPADMYDDLSPARRSPSAQPS